MLRPIFNKKNDFRGDLDVSINEEGQEQAEELVPFFANRKFSSAYRSSRKRTKETLKPLMEAKQMRSKVLKDLDSLDTGDLAGKPKSKKNLKLLKYYRNNPDETIPGGEKVQDFRDRVDPKIMSLIHKGESGSKPVVACVHGSIIKEIGRFLHGDMDYVKVEPGGVVGIFKSPSGYEAQPLFKESKESEEVYAGS
jgi:broad specificity phosphatase PhoE